MTKWDDYYMDIAGRTAELSSCKRKKVGAILVKEHRIISTGYNGTLPGEDNCCEGENGLTKDDVLHAEENVLLKMASSNESSEGSTMYITCAPCIKCSRMLIQAGVKKIFYSEIYGGHDNLDLLTRHNVLCVKKEI
jgi:dCMP deaminase